MNANRLKQPLILLSLALLIANDHILKSSPFSGFLTGKLSDFAGLFFFPFFVADCLRSRSQTIFDAICLFTALGFALLKTSPEFRDLFLAMYRAFDMTAAVVQDRTDLFALIMLPLAAYWERRQRQKHSVSSSTRTSHREE